MSEQLEALVAKYKALGIDQQLDYDKFYLYSIITHSTAIEGSTITELENQIMFDQGVSLRGKNLIEQNMNLDLKNAYERAISLAKAHTPFSVNMLIDLSSLVMRNTGSDYHTVLGDFSSAKGELRLVNVTAGVGGKSYMSYTKVPTRLTAFCEELNRARMNMADMSLSKLYELSFDAHYQLVTIHPWADGNGRMARLVMNMLQFEFGLIPSKILTEDKEEYIKALVETRENDDLSVFRDFMEQTMIKNLTSDIQNYMQSIGETETHHKEMSSRERIVALLTKDNTITAKSLSVDLGITVKAIEKHLSKLKEEGIILRVGPARGGHWEVVKPNF